ncbi:Phosphoribosyltransferase [Streptomyces hygroscopicus subsp. limoneus]|nr:Phosphoribosyltransferase [Streptomyces hygroscopicus subsp. limoneus]
MPATLGPPGASRGFLLGAAVAVELGVGFFAVRKQEGLFPGEKLTRQTSPDYRRLRHELRIRRASLTPSDRVLMVDDWIETMRGFSRTIVLACGG